MKILTNSQFNQLTQNRNREDGRSFGNISGDLPIADYVMTVEITADWTQQSGGGYTAQAKLVAFDDGAFSLDGGEFPIWNPMFSLEKPSNAVGDRMAVCYRGRWEVIGGGGGGGNPLIEDTLTSTLIAKGQATTLKEHIVYAPVLANGRASASGTNIVHQKGSDGRQWVVNVESYTTALTLNTPTLTASGNGVQVSVPNWMSTTNIGIQWTQYHPTNTWTNITTIPSWPHVVTPVNPGWVFVRLYSTSSGTNILASPWSSLFARGSILDGDLFIATPVSGTPTESVTVTMGSWYNSIPSQLRDRYTLQTGYMASGNTPPSSWSSTSSQAIPISGTRDIWARINVENRASVTAFGGAYTSQAITGVKLGTWSRT